MHKFENFTSEEKIKAWINESIKECHASYPMVGVELPVAVDIGANVGGFCVRAYEYFETIYAFEPVAANCAYAAQVLTSLEIDNVQLFHLAVTSTPGKIVPLSQPDGSERVSGNVTCCNIPGVETQSIGESCETTSLDEIIEKFELSAIDYLKIDCEGAEYDILENFQDYDKITFMTMEIHDYAGLRQKRGLLNKLCKHFYLFELWDGSIDFDETLPSKSINDRIDEFSDGINNIFAVNKKYQELMNRLGPTLRVASTSSAWQAH